MGLNAVRSVSDAPELRASRSEDDGLGVLHGHFSTFNDWYRVDSSWEGTFLERVAPGAYDGTIRSDLADIRVLFDHGFDPSVGNKVLGPIRSLKEDGRGAAFEVPLFDTSYNRDLLPGLRAGQYGSSMRFEVVEDHWDKRPARSDHNPDGIAERTITKSRVMEFGPVTFPANNQATAGVRSDTDSYYSRLRNVDRGAYVRAMSNANLGMDGGLSGVDLGPEPAYEAADHTKCIAMFSSIAAIVQAADSYYGNVDSGGDSGGDSGYSMNSRWPLGGVRAPRERATGISAKWRRDDDTLRLLGIIH